MGFALITASRRRGRRCCTIKGSGIGGFANMIFTPSRSNQFRFNTSFERDNYQVPNDREAQDAGIRDQVKQRDAFVFLTLGTHKWASLRV